MRSNFITVAGQRPTAPDFAGAGYGVREGSKDWERRSKMVGWYARKGSDPLGGALNVVLRANVEQHEGIRRDHRGTVALGTLLISAANRFPPVLCFFFYVGHAYAGFFRSLSGSQGNLLPA